MRKTCRSYETASFLRGAEDHALLLTVMQAQACNWKPLRDLQFLRAWNLHTHFPHLHGTTNTHAPKRRSDEARGGACTAPCTSTHISSSLLLTATAAGRLQAGRPRWQLAGKLLRDLQLLVGQRHCNSYLAETRYSARAIHTVQTPGASIYIHPHSHAPPGHRQARGGAG